MATYATIDQNGFAQHETATERPAWERWQMQMLHNERATLEMDRMKYAMWMGTRRGLCRASKSGHDVIFNHNDGTRCDLSGDLRTARRQMATAGVDYSGVADDDAAWYRWLRDLYLEGKSLRSMRIVITRSFSVVAGTDESARDFIQMCESHREYERSHNMPPLLMEMGGVDLEQARCVRLKSDAGLLADRIVATPSAERLYSAIVDLLSGLPDSIRPSVPVYHKSLPESTRERLEEILGTQVNSWS